MDQFLYGLPLLGLVFEFVGYLIAILPNIAPIILRRRDTDRIRGAVRRDVRAIGRRQHRHRGHDAGRGVRRLGGRGLPGSGPRHDGWSGLRCLAGPRSRRSLLALLAGVVVSTVHAWLSITVEADQIISGTIINIAALGITGYLNALLSVGSPTSAGQFRQFESTG